MTPRTLRVASIVCLVIWAVIWFLFLLLRFSTFDIRTIPNAGPIFLAAFAIAFSTPLLATALAGVALIRQPQVLSSWVTLGCSIVAFFGQIGVFLITRWL